MNRFAIPRAGSVILAALWLAPCLAAGADVPVRIVETVPTETGLDDPSVPDAWRVWPEMMALATRTLDVAGFYFSDAPAEERVGSESRLEPVIRAIEEAGGRGVRARVLGDRGFYKTYPEILDRLAKAPGVEVRLIDFRSMAGGPMHAKYFVVDGTDAYVGSQNFDWRALEHIHEIGVQVRIPEYAQALGAVFLEDWDVAEQLAEPQTVGSAPWFSINAEPRFPVEWVDATGDTALLWPAMSPQDFLPDSTQWDLPLILDLLRGARDSLQVTVLTYSPVSRDSTFWPVLDDALRDAAARGVVVRLLVSNWNTRAPAIDYLKSLEVLPGVEVRILSIPEASTGFIPFARVTHAKYLTVDGRWSWIGTSNWEESYFTKTRNVGMIVRSRDLTSTLDRDFARWWTSRFAATVEVGREYVPPRVSD